MHDLNSPTTDQTHALCNGSATSSLWDHQGSPKASFLMPFCWFLLTERSCFRFWDILWNHLRDLRQVKGSCSRRGHSEFSPRSQLGFLWKNGWGRGVLMSLAGEFILNFSIHANLLRLWIGNSAITIEWSSNSVNFISFLKWERYQSLIMQH